jgi:GDP-L-fucose synthase
MKNNMNKNVLVTGGSGFLGRRLKLSQPDWVYISSKDCDLTNTEQVKQLFGDIKPDAVLHLAARVGGIKDNIENQADFYHINTMMNTNVIHQAYKAGIPRVLSSLSTCAFPEEVSFFPFLEEEFFKGPPTITNFSYGMTKRMLHVSSCAYREQYNMNYSTFCPSNIYGPEDHFGSQASHFVAALIHKIYNATDGDIVEMWGTGMPLRQQLYVDDLCKIIPILLEKHNTSIPLIVAPNENLSILEMTRTLVEQTGKNVRTLFNGNMDGQFRKDGSNGRLLELIGPFDFTSFRDGVHKTYQWYSENK